MEIGKINTVILISSCDSYQEVWYPFFTLFFRYWPDCPFPIYLITNRISYPDRRVHSMKLGDDQGWGTNILIALNSIAETHILYLQEDYLLERFVDTARIFRLLNYMKKRQAGYLRLYPCPGPDLPSADNHMEVGEISRLAPYRVSLQAAIWHKPTLQALLLQGESPWQMERFGTKRSQELNVPFLCVQNNGVDDIIDDPAIPYYCTAIVQGRWVRGAVDLCTREGIHLADRALPIETDFQKWWRESRIRPWIMVGLSPAFGLRRRLLSLKKRLHAFLTTGKDRGNIFSR